MRFLVQFANETGDWVPWSVMTEYDWEGGAEFPDIREGFETKTLWISVDYDEVMKLLNPPDLEGKISS